jgi:oxysterol-binding protein-related protein 8
VSNRKEGFAVQGSILARSKFYGIIRVQLFVIFIEYDIVHVICLGNSLSAILDGTARLTLLNRGEDYVITMPYANCKGKQSMNTKCSPSI